MNQPIKRSFALQPLSREHHQGLMLGWKIRQGFAKNADPLVMMNYARWFYQEHLVPHFDAEEKLLFPVLGNNHPMIAQALEEHRRLTNLFLNEEVSKETLNSIADELDKHIRFEERVLFVEIEKHATTGQLEEIQKLHREEIFCENNSDKFW